MSFSGSTDFGQYCSDIVTKALIKTHRVALGQDVPGEEMEHGREVLNMIVHELQDEKVFLWSVERTTLALTQGTATYTLANDTLDVLPREISVLRNGTYTQVARITREEYYRKPDRGTSTGKPLQLMVERNRTATIGQHAFTDLLTVTLYPIPENSTDVLHYTRVRRLQDLDASTNDPDAPQRLALTLINLLAAELSPDYGLDVNERADLVARAMGKLSRAKRGDTERTGFRLVPRMR